MKWIRKIYWKEKGKKDVYFGVDENLFTLPTCVPTKLLPTNRYSIWYYFNLILISILKIILDIVSCT